MSREIRDLLPRRDWTWAPPFAQPLETIAATDRTLAGADAPAGARCFMGKALRSPLLGPLLSPAFYTSENRCTEKLNVSSKVTQLVSVGVWILTQADLFSEASFHSSTIFLSDGQTVFLQ